MRPNALPWVDSMVIGSVGTDKVGRKYWFSHLIILAPSVSRFGNRIAYADIFVELSD